MISSLRETFLREFPATPGEGAALCIFRGGKELLHLVTGEAQIGTPWTPSTLVPIFSATKPASAACLLQALLEKGGSPDTPIGDIWSAFPVPHGTVEQLLSHQLGLAAWAREASVFDLDACRSAVEASSPLWSPPQHGYHPHSLGPMVDILMQLLTGERVKDFWESRVRRPLGLDFFIGLPDSEFPRVAELHLPRLHAPLPSTPFYREYFDTASPVYAAFRCVSGLPSVRSMNEAPGRRCACPARGGIASARGLALFYQALLGEVGNSPFSPVVREWISRTVVRGFDLTLRQSTAFTCGAMSEPAELFGNGGFGHAGAGGCHAFADPSGGFSFACVMNGMQIGVLPGDRMLRILRAMADDATWLSQETFRGTPQHG